MLAAEFTKKAIEKKNLEKQELERQRQFAMEMVAA